VTGAYCRLLASNYNRAMRLPVVFCQDSQSHLVVSRETHPGLLSVTSLRADDRHRAGPICLTAGTCQHAQYGTCQHAQ